MSASGFFFYFFVLVAEGMQDADGDGRFLTLNLEDDEEEEDGDQDDQEHENGEFHPPPTELLVNSATEVDPLSIIDDDPPKEKPLLSHFRLWALSMFILGRASLWLLS